MPLALPVAPATSTTPFASLHAQRVSPGTSLKSSRRSGASQTGPSMKPKPVPSCSGSASASTSSCGVSSWAIRAIGGANLQQPPVAQHRRVAHVAVGLAPQAHDALVVVGAGQRLAVPDDVLRGDAVALLEPAGQAQARAQLAAVAHHLGVGEPDVLDTDRRPVQAHRVTAAQPQRDELVDGAVAVDHEMRAGARPLVEL